MYMGLPGFGPEFPTPEAGRIPGYPTDPFFPDVKYDYYLCLENCGLLFFLANGVKNIFIFHN